ncbi:hypothetical protein I3842_01G234700 [Carya illinoinensis]|uniref:Uncharacterized protein n=1 Tax=Carya illinoinensis TaxID=32201 RepID=A0A922KAJ1_CARIL|nr:hypothetical protein I3842_01G234700 [Carya illinoinensis]
MEGQDSHMASLLACFGSNHDTQRASMEATDHVQTMRAGLRVPLSVHLRACMRAPTPPSKASGVPPQARHPAHGSSPCLAEQVSGMPRGVPSSAWLQPMPCGAGQWHAHQACQPAHGSSPCLADSAPRPPA